MPRRSSRPQQPRHPRRLVTGGVDQEGGRPEYVRKGPPGPVARYWTTVGATVVSTGAIGKSLKKDAHEFEHGFAVSRETFVTVIANLVDVYERERRFEDMVRCRNFHRRASATTG